MKRDLKKVYIIISHWGELSCVEGVYDDEELAEKDWNKLLKEYEITKVNDYGSTLVTERNKDGDYLHFTTTFMNMLSNSKEWNEVVLNDSRNFDAT